MKEFANKPLTPSRTLDNVSRTSKQVREADRVPIDIILQRYEESMHRYASRMDVRSNQGNGGIIKNKSCFFTGGVIQGVFINLDSEIGQDFIEKDREIITVINNRITDLLKEQDEKRRWLGRFPKKLKLGWVRDLLGQGEEEIVKIVNTVCSNLINFPFVIAEFPQSENTLRMLRGVDETIVESIDVKNDIYEFDVVEIDKEGKVIETGGKTEKMIHPIFRDVVGPLFSFIKVVLPSDATAETFNTLIEHKGKKYKINVIAGSSLKPSIDSAGSVYGIEEGSKDVLKKVLGFEESSYYAQRAFFPLVVGGVKGQIKGRALPVEDKNKKTFKLKDGTPVQLEDGWGYIIKSLADKMQIGELSREKRRPISESGRASYQMYEWLDTEDTDVVSELVESGLQAWKNFKKNDQLWSGSTTSDIDKLKILHSILTTGKPSMEMAVAMPVAGDKIVIPDEERFTGKLPGEKGVAIIRSPADKQNFYPIESAQIDRQGNISKFISGMEGLQYTLTGKDRGSLTFFKGMLGIISDGQWPEEWTGVDLVVTSKDRKLYEEWQKDSSLQEDDEAGTAQEDRSAAQATAQDFLIQGDLIATQWFEKGSFVGVPHAIQKWLGGDYDGDEIGMIFESITPELYKRTKAVFKKEEVNPKLKKTFTYRPGSSREKRIMDMRSWNVGMWSKIAARVKSLPRKQYDALVRYTSEGRLLPPDSSLDGLTEEERMMKEIQFGIKVGTDAFKTDAKTSDFEERARYYSTCLNTLSPPIQHDRRIQQIIAKVGICPTLRSPEWRNIYFSYNTIDANTGEYQVKGMSPRILQRMIRFLLPPQDIAYLDWYYGLWLAETKTNTICHWQSGDYFLKKIDEYNKETKQGATANYIQRIFRRWKITNYDNFEQAYFLTVEWYWAMFNRYAFEKYQRKDAEWKQGLTKLLKQYYVLSA